MKDYLNENGFDVKSPKEAIRQAFNSEYIADGQIWMDAIDKRNESSHAYDETILSNTVGFILNEFFPVAENFYHGFKSLMDEK